MGADSRGVISPNKFSITNIVNESFNRGNMFTLTRQSYQASTRLCQLRLLPHIPTRAFHTSLLVLAVPKNRTSPARKAWKNYQDSLKPVSHIVDCNHCNRTILFGHVCTCGWYKGKPFTLRAVRQYEKKLKREDKVEEVQAAEIR